MEEVVCAERSGFPFGPGAWPEFWTLLFLSLARPLAVRGARCERVGSRFGASGSLSRPLLASLLVSFIESNERVGCGEMRVVERSDARAMCSRECLD